MNFTMQKNTGKNLGFGEDNKSNDENYKKFMRLYDSVLYSNHNF